MKIEELYYTGDGSVRPDELSYFAVMNGWLKSGSPKRVERVADVFQRLCKMFKSGNKNAEPKFQSCAMFLEVIAKGGEKGYAYAQQAESVLRHIFERYEGGNLNWKLNAPLITSVMNCYARSGARNAGEKVEFMLDWMLDTYVEEENGVYRPNAVSFSIGKTYVAAGMVYVRDPIPTYFLA